jgi:hypothetical protein
MFLKPNSRSRSRITLTDQNTKIGTLLNGEQIRGTSVVLDRDENTVTLGRFKHQFLYVPSDFENCFILTRV